MIKRFVVGNPLETEAILNKVQMSEEKIPYLSVTQQGFSYKLEPEDIVYGLGENVRGINKRGWLYESNCTDNPFHQEDTRSLYGAHNFLIVCGKESDLSPTIGQLCVCQVESLLAAYAEKNDKNSLGNPFVAVPVYRYDAVGSA